MRVERETDLIMGINYANARYTTQYVHQYGAGEYKAAVQCSVSYHKVS